MTRTANRKSSLPDYDKAKRLLDENCKARYVTAGNFGQLFRCFAVVNGENSDYMGVNINPIDHASQWGAWRHYRIEKGLPVYAMNLIGERLAQMDKASRQSAVGFVVPCDWPADFDGQRHEADDKLAADRFVAAQERKRQQVKEMANLSPEERAAHVQRAIIKTYKAVQDAKAD